jgi:aspartate aminotransferase-like enzyme
MKRDPFTTDRLFCPGPTPRYEPGSNPDVYHRSTEFSKLFEHTADLLQELIGSKERPILLSCSGTGAMEAAVLNFTSPEDEVIVLSAGKFGDRWQNLCETFDCQVNVLEVPFGEAPTPDQVVEFVKANPNSKAMFFQANETATGVRFPVEEIVRAVRLSFNGLIIIDAISSLCAHHMDMLDWNVDVVIGGSQKGFGVSPGLAFIAVSSRAWDAISDRPRYYFSLEKERNGQRKGLSAYTPPIALIQDLAEALSRMHKIGFSNVIHHHQIRAQATRAAVEAMGLDLFAKGHPSDALTAIVVPPGIDGKELLSYLRTKFGFYYAGGQDSLKGLIIRMAHLGFMSRFDVLNGIAGLEFGLDHFGFKFEMGIGSKAAVCSFAEND